MCKVITMVLREKHLELISSFEYNINEATFKQLFKQYVPKNVADVAWEKFKAVNFSAAKFWQIDKKMGRILIKVIKDHGNLKLRVEQYK